MHIYRGHFVWLIELELLNLFCTMPMITKQNTFPSARNDGMDDMYRIPCECALET